jgi:hypothetical protein
VDPRCGLCFWGLSLSYGKNLNAGVSDYAKSREAAMEASRLAGRHQLGPVQSDLIAAQLARCRAENEVKRPEDFHFPFFLSFYVHCY